MSENHGRRCGAATAAVGLGDVSVLDLGFGSITTNPVSPGIT
jgi:hypothetical protein